MKPAFRWARSIVLSVGLAGLAGLVPGAAAAWTLPIPRNTAIHSNQDLRGALIQVGEEKTLQIEEVEWAITPEGDLGLHRFRGYDEAGALIDDTRQSFAGRTASSLAELGGFRLGRPEAPDQLIEVYTATFRTDGDGFLVIRTLSGTVSATGEPISLASDGPCTLRLFVFCENHSCPTLCRFPLCECDGPGLPGRCRIYSFLGCVGSCSSGGCAYSEGYCICLVIGPGEEPVQDPGGPIRFDRKRP